VLEGVQAAAAAEIREAVGRERENDYSGFTREALAAFLGVGPETIDFWQKKGMQECFFPA
jgi:hypothetical protein